MFLEEDFQHKKILVTFKVCFLSKFFEFLGKRPWSVFYSVQRESIELSQSDVG